MMMGKLSFFDLEKDLAESEQFKNEPFFGYFFMGQPTLVIRDEEMAKRIMIKESRGERLLRTHILIGQEVQFPSSDWTRATELYLLSNQTMSF